LGVFKNKMSSENIFPPYGLRCEYATSPLGLDVKRPRFTWLLRHKERDIGVEVGVNAPVNSTAVLYTQI